MNSDSIRRSNIIETIARASFAGVQWRAVFSELMSEMGISQEDVEARIAEKRAMGMSGLTPAEISMLDEYISEWFDVVNIVGPGPTPLHELTTQIQPLINTLYKDVFKISLPPKIVFCQSPAKLAIFMKVLLEQKATRRFIPPRSFEHLQSKSFLTSRAKSKKNF